MKIESGIFFTKKDCCFKNCFVIKPASQTRFHKSLITQNLMKKKKLALKKATVQKLNTSSLKRHKGGVAPQPVQTTQGSQTCPPPTSPAVCGAL